MPVAPGIRPSVTSGMPNWIFGSSSAKRCVADQRHLPAAAERRAVEAARRPAGRASRACGSSPSSPRSRAKHVRRVRSAAACITLFRSAPAKKVVLAEASSTPLMRSLSRPSCAAASARSACHCARHRVDRRAGLVEGDRGDAVGIEFVADGFHACRPQTRSTMVAMPMPPPTHSVTRPRLQLAPLAARRAACRASIAPVAPSGWPMRDRAAVDVDLLVRHAHLLHEAHRHRGERLVDLEQVDVVDRQAGLGERLARRRHRAGEHDGRVGAGERGRDDARRAASSPSSRPLASLPISTAAAPSTMPDELPAVCTCSMRSTCG